MSRPPASAEAALARLGMRAEAAIPALRQLGIWGDDGPGTDAWPIIEALAASPNTDQSLRALVRLFERSPDGWAELVEGETPDAPGPVHRASVVAGASAALGDRLATDPAALEVLVGDLRRWVREDLEAACRAEMAAADDPAEAMVAAQRRGLLRIAARDLLGVATTPEVAAELAALADGILGAAFSRVLEELDAQDVRVTVVAMGKLGGRELNYVSDVDVIFVCDDDWAAAQRVCERFLRLCGKMTPQGAAYDVDPNLRPEGRDGPLVRTLEAYQGYYERWAKTWEFQALLKARPFAGDLELGQEFMSLVEPFVWPDRLEAQAVDEIQRMKGVVEDSREVQRAGTRQVKLGPGGLRDIEFAVQLLQLVHGRHDPALRSPTTLEALAALAEGGYVGEEDAEEFRDAYVFLRTVEHRLQLSRLRRTHTVPRQDAERTRLARAMGYREWEGKSALQLFDADFRGVQGIVRHLHEKLFYRPLLSRFAQIGAEDSVVSPADAREAPQLDEQGAADRLSALGFADPRGALRHLDVLASGVSRRARLFRTMLPALLPILAESPDPDSGLAAFRSLADRLEQSPVFLRTLRDTPPVGDVLAQVLGSSKVVGEWLQRQPEVLGYLADLDGLGKTLTAVDYRRLADGLLRRGQSSDESADALRRLKRREVARTAVRELTGGAALPAVFTELTGLAEACLEAALALAVNDAGDEAEDLRLAVIGMGKLGGQELSYASDLDVMLVYEPAGAGDVAVRVAEGMLKILSGITPEGQAFLVDANLRPEGKDGPLARSLESYRAYYERWAQTWELQALTQARSVAGDADLGAAFLEMVAEYVYPPDPPGRRLQDVRLMKARVERERGGARRQTRTVRGRPQPRPRGAPASAPRPGRWVGDRIDLKLGEGGLSDVEWTVQLLQLHHGGGIAALRRPGTVPGLEALEQADVLSSEDAGWLREGYQLLARVRNALYLAGFRDPSVLPPGPRDQEHVARMLGFPRPGAQALMEEIGRVTRRVRKVHERRFYDG